MMYKIQAAKYYLVNRPMATPLIIAYRRRNKVTRLIAKGRERGILEGGREGNREGGLAMRRGIHAVEFQFDFKNDTILVEKCKVHLNGHKM